MVTTMRYTFTRTMVTGLLVFGLLGGQGANAALLDGLMDGVEETLAERLADRNERLTTGNFYTDARPNAHGPIGMMGDHTHEAGEVMFSYRLMHMWMQGTRLGTNSLTNAEAINLAPMNTGLPPNAPAPLGFGYLAQPESMRMIMHMFGFMYGLNDTVTLMAMVPYTHLNMNHFTRDGRKFITKSEGIGDIRFGSLWRLWAVEAPSIGAHRFHANFAFSVPTGDIEPRDTIPVPEQLNQPGNILDVRLPYPMHLGSGTFDFYPGITYGGEMGRASWGFQTIGTLRAGKNTNDFSKGDAYVVNIHGAYELIQRRLSGSVRFSWNHWEAYNGRDPRIGHPVNAVNQNFPRILPAPVQTGRPELLGGQRLDIFGGVNLLLPEFMGFETRLAVEGGVPIYQYLDGQLETDSIVTFGWQAVY